MSFTNHNSDRHGFAQKLPISYSTQPNSLAKSSSINRIVHSWLPSLHHKELICTQSSYSISYKNVLLLPTFVLFLLPLSSLGCISCIRSFLSLFYCYPTWMCLSRLCLSGFSSGKSSIIQPEEISLFCSGGILWLSVLIHHSLPFILVVHFIFSSDCKILKNREDALFIFIISPHDPSAIPDW